LINEIAFVINHDPLARDRLRVVFLPNFNVTLAERIYPAADVSEQLSMAGMEASGTGNMKMALNGAVTLGTLDGANIEIRRRAGPENFFHFGLSVDEARALKEGSYDPHALYLANSELQQALDLIASGRFSHGDRELFRPIVDGLIYRDDFLLLADFDAYLACQERVELAYRDRERWTRMSILNAARCGYFSSDRTIAEYCRDIWQVVPVPVETKSDR
jgi:glycogen phosphorylase